MFGNQINKCYLCGPKSKNDFQRFHIPRHSRALPPEPACSGGPHGSRVGGGITYYKSANYIVSRPILARNFCHPEQRHAELDSASMRLRVKPAMTNENYQTTINNLNSIKS